MLTYFLHILNKIAWFGANLHLWALDRLKMDLQLELNSSEDECKVACDAVPDHEDADGHGHGHSPSGGGLPVSSKL